MGELGEHAEHVWAIIGTGHVSAVSSGPGNYEPMAYPGNPWTKFGTDGDVAEVPDSTASMSGAPGCELGAGPEYVDS